MNSLSEKKMSSVWNDESLPRKSNRITEVGIKKNLTITAAFLMSCFFIYSCVNDPKEIEDMTRQNIMIDEGKNIVSYLSQKGELKAKLTAPIMNRYATNKTDTVYFEFPNSLHADFYDSTGKRESWLDSKHGKYFQTLNKVYLWDSVVVINVRGDTLKSPDLWWDQGTKMFYTDKLAYYFAPDKRITAGQGIEATQDLSHVTFKNLLPSTIRVSENGLGSDSTQ
jgi:LPS export ABC transporter protein LptC